MTIERDVYPAEVNKDQMETMYEIGMAFQPDFERPGDREKFGIMEYKGRLLMTEPLRAIRKHAKDLWARLEQSCKCIFLARYAVRALAYVSRISRTFESFGVSPVKLDNAITWAREAIADEMEHAVSLAVKQKEKSKSESADDDKGTQDIDEEESEPVSKLNQRIPAEIRQRFAEAVERDPSESMKGVVATISMGGMSRTEIPEDFNVTKRDEANALTSFAFRNCGLLENLHAGRHHKALEDPDVSRISDEEMREMMISASTMLATLLRLKEEDPKLYQMLLISIYRVGGIKNWER